MPYGALDTPLAHDDTQDASAESNGHRYYRLVDRPVVRLAHHERAGTNSLKQAFPLIDPVVVGEFQAELANAISYNICVGSRIYRQGLGYEA